MEWMEWMEWMVGKDKRVEEEEGKWVGVDDY
jgi:hypothetical protein